MKYNQKTIDKYRDINIEPLWWEFVYDDFEQICKILGVVLDKDEPSFSGFWSQGDGASFTGAYHDRGIEWQGEWGEAGTPHQMRLVATHYAETAPEKIREYAPKDEVLHTIADELRILSRLYGPLDAKIERSSRGNYVHDGTMAVEVYLERYDSNVEDVDEASATTIVAHVEALFLEQMRDLACWLYKQLEKEHDYLTSDEAVIEALEANEIENEEEED